MAQPPLLLRTTWYKFHIFRAVSKRTFRNAEEQGTRRGVRSEKQKGHDCILGLFRKGTAVSLRRRAIKI